MVNPWRAKDPAIPLRIREALRVLAGLAALAIICAWPQLTAPERLTELDPGSFRRLALVADPGASHEMPLFAREVLWTVPGRMLMERGLSLEFAALALMLIGTFFTGLVTWLLLRWLSRAPLASFAAAAILVVQPWRTTSLGDPALSWLFGPALAFLGTVWITRAGGWTAGLVAGTGIALTGYTSFAQLPPTLFGCALLLVAHVPLMLRPFPAGESVGWRKLGLGLGAAVASAVALLWPALVQGLPDAPPGAGTSAAGWFAEDGRMQFLGVEASPGGNHYFWPVFLGWIVLFVMVWIAFNVRDPRLRPWWLLMVASFLLVQGSRLHFLGNEVPTLMMPSAWLAGLPGFDRLPGPSAWLPFLGLSIAAVLALGLKEWQVQHGRTATFLIAAFSALEMRPMPLESNHLQPPSVYAKMTSAARGSVLELPLDPGNAVALWHSAATHGRPVLFAPVLAGAPPDRLAGVPPGLLTALSPEAPTAVSAVAEPANAALRRLQDADPAQLEAWRRWLVEDAGVRWVVFRRAPDISVGAPRQDHSTWGAKIKRGLTPWYFNEDVLADRHLSARELVEDYKALSARSTRAQALMVHWFGRPEARQGSAYAEAWQVQPERSTARNDAAEAVPAAAPAPAGG